MALTIGTKVGPYEITAAIGPGGMGEVYRARDPRLGREVAIKVLPAEATADEERRQRFAREARAASSHSHPNVATIYEFGESEGRAFIAMELVDEQPLNKRIGGRPLAARDMGRHPFFAAGRPITAFFSRKITIAKTGRLRAPSISHGSAHVVIFVPGLPDAISG